MSTYPIYHPITSMKRHTWYLLSTQYLRCIEAKCCIEVVEAVELHCKLSRSSWVVLSTQYLRCIEAKCCIEAVEAVELHCKLSWSSWVALRSSWVASCVASKQSCVASKQNDGKELKIITISWQSVNSPKILLLRKPKTLENFIKSLILYDFHFILLKIKHNKLKFCFYDVTKMLFLARAFHISTLSVLSGLRVTKMATTWSRQNNGCKK